MRNVRISNPHDKEINQPKSLRVGGVCAILSVLFLTSAIIANVSKGDFSTKPPSVFNFYYALLAKDLDGWLIIIGAFIIIFTAIAIDIFLRSPKSWRWRAPVSIIVDTFSLFIRYRLFLIAARHVDPDFRSVNNGLRSFFINFAGTIVTKIHFYLVIASSFIFGIRVGLIGFHILH